MNDFEKHADSAVHDQYERWPYPTISPLGKVRPEHLWQINLAWAQARCQLPPSTDSKILIAGCGTFQPYVFGLANPNSKIMATDISTTSLRAAEKRCRWHGIKNIRYAGLDLNNIASIPEGPFDWIECYGVLMNLDDPSASLNALAKQLSVNGVLRVMVYPHYGRQRVFQIQRLARLIGIDFRSADGPSRLKKFMASLPKSHPLSYAFFSYHDSRTNAGIVDGFLHAGDRAFTGIEISDLIENAGLQIGFCYHRPWGQPEIMAKRLGLENYDTALQLHYLDLWQNLHTNFILTLIRQDAPVHFPKATQSHPLLNLESKEISIRQQLRFKRFGITGTTLPSRTHAARLKIPASQWRRLMKGEPSGLPCDDILPGTHSGILGRPLLSTPTTITPRPHFVPRLHPDAPNPMYDYLFDAFSFSDDWGDLFKTPFPNLLDQIRRWAPHHQTLEDDLHQLGLTPYGTYRFAPSQIATITEAYRSAPISAFASLRLASDEGKLQRVRDFLRAQNILKTETRSDETLRELWVLLFSTNQLKLPLS